MIMTSNTITVNGKEILLNYMTDVSETVTRIVGNGFIAASWIELENNEYTVKLPEMTTDNVINVVSHGPFATIEEAVILALV